MNPDARCPMPDGRASAFRATALASGIAFLLVALPALADLTTSSLTGYVRAGDAPAPNVTVTASSAALQHPRTTVTNARGAYFFDALPPGEYDVTFSRAGLTSLTRRAVVQPARVARADAVLEPSEDEESVTSTATTPSAIETAITTHFDERTLELLPQRRSVFTIGGLAPRTLSAALVLVDDVFLTEPHFVAEESMEQITAVREAVPVELARTTIAARTRSGREQFFLSLRDTLTNTDWIDDRHRAFSQPEGTQHHLEAAAGGRIVRERLWFFAGAWSGEQVDVARNDARGSLIKLTGSPGAAHSITAAYFDAQSQFSTFRPRDSSTAFWARYTGVAGPRFTAEVLAARSVLDEGFFGAEDIDTVDVRSSYFAAGNHLLAAGVSHDLSDHWAVYASDRWSVARWTVYAGLRHEETFASADTLPRIAVAYDLRGDARRAVIASYGEYRAFTDAVRVATLGYATTLGATGNLRVDVLRRHEESREIHEAQVDGHYRLFGRLEVGGNYSYVRDIDSSHVGHAWAGVALPLFGHEIGVTYVQRLVIGRFAAGAPERETAAPADLALRYTIPLARTHVTFALDSLNVFGTAPVRAQGPRSTRLWVRVRI